MKGITLIVGINNICYRNVVWTYIIQILLINIFILNINYKNSIPFFCVFQLKYNNCHKSQKI